MTVAAPWAARVDIQRGISHHATVKPLLLKLFEAFVRALPRAAAWVLVIALCVVAARGADWFPPGIALPLIIMLGAMLDRRFGGKYRASLAESRREAEALFLKFTIIADDPRHAFCGNTASVVDDHEKFYPSLQLCLSWHYDLTRYARNAAGEYFMCICKLVEGQAPTCFVKPLAQERARFVLGKKYVSPPGAHQ